MTRVQELYPDSKIILREVGLRDGLQLVKTFPSTEAKQRWIRDEYAAGVRHFEVGSFLPAKTFPQFADVRDIIGTVASLPGAYGIALTLNERGVNEALASGVAEVATVVSATEEHSQANANRSRKSAIANVKRLCELRDASAHKPVVNSAISMALGCSIVGAVDPKEVLLLTEKLFEAGVDMVAIADTVGYAGPKQVGELTAAAVKIAGSKPICIHLHDTRGMGIANASAALDAGARVLDGSLGGLGGCPFAPGATGNVVFEDLVFLCESKGFATGIDIEKLIAVRSILKSEMPGEALYGGLARAGLAARNGGQGGLIQSRQRLLFAHTHAAHAHARHASLFLLFGGRLRRHHRHCFHPHMRSEEIVGRLLLIVRQSLVQFGEGGFHRSGAVEPRGQPLLLLVQPG